MITSAQPMVNGPTSSACAANVQWSMFNVQYLISYGSGHSSTLSILRSFSGLKQRCIFLSFSLLNSSGLSQGSLLMPAMSEPMPSSLTRCESLSSCCITSDSSMMTAVTSERFTEQLRCTSLASWSVSMVPMFTACGNHFPGCAVCVLVSFDILYIIAMLLS